MQAISQEDIVRRIRTENPWWEGDHNIAELYRKMRPRHYFELFAPLVKTRSVRRAVVMMGPRRVGKTVMIHHAVQALLDEGVPPQSICYLSVDHPLYSGLSLENLLDFYSHSSGVDYKSQRVFIFFDEIQYLRNWEVRLKSLVDTYPNIKSIASGSAAAALRLKSTESGAGRFTDFLLPPLTFYECLYLLNRTEGLEGALKEEVQKGQEGCVEPENIERLNELFLFYLNFGGYPEVIFSPQVQADPARFIKSDIIDKVLLRDLPSLYGIGDIQELNHLFTTLAFNTGNEISLAELSQNSGVAKNTLKRYIEYLEAAFLIKVVHRVDRNAKRFRRANFFKIYLTNPSMRAALFTPVKADDNAVASLAETAILSQWFHSDEPIHYARWHDGEVDIVYVWPENQKVAWAVEVKWSDRYCDSPGELQSVLSFCQANHLKRVSVTSKTRKTICEVGGVRIEFVPASIYCLRVGYNLVHGKDMLPTEEPTEMRTPWDQ